MSAPFEVDATTREQLDKIRLWVGFRLADELIAGDVDVDSWAEVWELYQKMFGRVDKPADVDLDAPRAVIVDYVIAYSIKNDRCDLVNDILTAVFGTAPGEDGLWRDSLGRDYEGLYPDGFNDAGVNRFGYGRDGFNKDGYDNMGYGKDGFHKHRNTNRQGVYRNDWLKTMDPVAIAALVAGWSNDYRALIVTEIVAQTEQA